MSGPVERRQRPIGVFDSGLGGLTVARAIRRELPSEELIYLGDTARVPYGTRSAQTVVRYARTCARRLQEHQPKVLVVACNTVSAVAIDVLRVELDVPVLGVIEPGARAGVSASETGRIGVIATAGTVRSGAYSRAITSVSTRAHVVARAAPLLVPLAEEGWLQGEVPTRVVERYLEPFSHDDIDALILGCTHYPLFRDIIEAVSEELLGPGVRVVDSADATADELATLLRERDLLREGQGGLRVLVTDLPERFEDVASRFLGAPIPEAQQVDL